MPIAGSNMRLGWLMLAAVAWAYLGLLVALGMAEGPGGERMLRLGLQRPEVIVLPGRLLSLNETREGLELVLALPPDGKAPKLPPALPGHVQVKYEPAPDEPRRPRIALHGGRGPFRMPTGGMGVIAAGFLVRINPDEVHLGQIPERMGERFRRGERERFDEPHGGEHRGEPHDRRGPDGPPEGERRRDAQQDEQRLDAPQDRRREGGQPRRDGASPRDQQPPREGR